MEDVTESAIYPILAKSTKNGLLETKSRPSDSGPPRRYYKLTPLGRVWLIKISKFMEKLEEDLNQ